MGIVESLKFKKRPSQLKIDESTELSCASVRKLALVIGSVWWAEGWSRGEFMGCEEVKTVILSFYQDAWQ